MVECTTREIDQVTRPDLEDPWSEVSTDWSSSKKGLGGEVFLTSPEGFKVYYALRRPSDEMSEEL